MGDIVSAFGNTKPVLLDIAEYTAMTRVFSKGTDDNSGEWMKIGEEDGVENR